MSFRSVPKVVENAHCHQGYWADEPLTQLLEEQADKQGKKVAIIDGKRQVTYRELEQLANRLAWYLSQQGVNSFDTALVQLPNCLDFYVTYFALLKLGVASVNAYMTHQQEELDSFVDQLNPSVLIMSCQHALFEKEDYLNHLQQKQGPFKAIVSLESCHFAPSLSDIMSEQALMPFESLSFDQASDPDQVAFYKLSFCEAGVPTLVPRTHNDQLYSLRKSIELCGLASNTRYLCALPVQHSFILSSPGALGVFYVGGTLIISPSSQPLPCFALIQEHQVTMTALVSGMMDAWLAAASYSASQLTSLQLVQVGGESVTKSQVKRLAQGLASQIQLVSSLPQGLENAMSKRERVQVKATSLNRASNGTGIKQMEQSMPASAAVSLLCQHKQVSKGYFNSPAYRQSAFLDHSLPSLQSHKH